MTAVSTLANAAVALGRICGRMVPLLADDSRDALLRSFGLLPPPGLLDASSVASPLTALSDAADAVDAAAVELQQAVGQDDDAAEALAATALIAAIAGVGAALGAAKSALEAISGTLPGLSAAQRTELHDFAGTFIARLRDRILTDEWRERSPQLSAALLGAGLIEIVDDAGGGTGSLYIASTQRRLRPDRLSKFVSDPSAYIGDVYGWGTPTFDGTALFRTVQAILADNAVPSDLLAPPGLPPSLEAFIFRLELDSTVVPPGLEVALRFPANVSAVTTLTADDWQFPVQATLQFDADVELGLRPPFSLGLRSTSGSARATLLAQATRAGGADPVVLFGDGDASHLEARVVTLGASVDSGDLDAASTKATSMQLTGSIAGGKVVISGSGDSFVSRVLGGRDLAASFDVAATWDPAGGLRFTKAPALEIDVPVQASLGPVFVDTVHVGLGLDASGVVLEVSASAGAVLGPLTIELDRVGIRGHLAFTEDAGNLGIAQLDVAWQSPRGAGLQVAAGPVTGGGALSIDPATGTYEGTIALRVFDIGISAEGLVTTHPFSFALVVSVDTMGIPIGLGFTLDGVGGLIAVDRGADVDVLRSAIRSGGMDGIFFPTDPIAHAARLAGDLARYFPVAEGRYLFGPAAKIGWGEPRVFSGVIALLLELPAPVRLVMIAQLRLGLPTLSAPIVDIRIDALGVLDLERKTLALDASLHDSNLAGYPLTGDMALRFGWGPSPDLLFSVGGFHPHYTPPAGFPALRRLALTAGDNPQLCLSCYLAFTSNTAQVGADASLTASGGGFDIKAQLGFDALFVFVPFHFEIDIEATASVSWHGHHLLGLGLHFLLTGPHPWHAKGDASFSILWWDVSVGFDVTWGDPDVPALPPPPDIADALTDALGGADSWAGELPAGVAAMVVVTGAAAPGTAVVNPLASLVVRERVVPLDYDVDQFGNIPLAASQRFAIKTVAVDGDSVAKDDITDPFAPGQFTQLTVDERLVAPSFEPMHSGVRVGAGEVRIGVSARTSMADVTTVDDPLAPPNHVIGPIAVSSGLLAIAGVVRPTRPPGPPLRTGPQVRDVEYVLASVDDLTVTTDGSALAAGATGYAALREALRTHGAERLQIVPRAHAA